MHNVELNFWRINICWNNICMDEQALVKLLDNFSMERNTLQHTLPKFKGVFRSFFKDILLDFF